MAKDEVAKFRKLLGKILQRLRWDDQGGYVSRCKGKWDFVTGGLPQVTPKELDALFAFAGIVPDEIVSLGSCGGCAHSAVAADGRRVEQGYSAKACFTCKRPRMSNFVPLATVKRAG